MQPEFRRYSAMSYRRRNSSSTTSTTRGSNPFPDDFCMKDPICRAWARRCTDEHLWWGVRGSQTQGPCRDKSSNFRTVPYNNPFFAAQDFSVSVGSSLEMARQSRASHLQRETANHVRVYS